MRMWDVIVAEATVNRLFGKPNTNSKGVSSQLYFQPLGGRGKEIAKYKASLGYILHFKTPQRAEFGGIRLQSQNSGVRNRRIAMSLRLAWAIV
jgi:hypothetical protein